MKFIDPKNPKAFPRGKLLWTWVPTFSFVSLALLSDAMDYAWDVHGNAIAIVAWILFSSLIASVVALIDLPKAWSGIVQHPPLRTIHNIASVVLSSLLLLATFFFYASVVHSIWLHV
jgi:hypothetical protein